MSRDIIVYDAINGWQSGRSDKILRFPKPSPL